LKNDPQIGIAPEIAAEIAAINVLRGRKVIIAAKAAVKGSLQDAYLFVGRVSAVYFRFAANLEVLQFAKIPSKHIRPNVRVDPNHNLFRNPIDRRMNGTMGLGGTEGQ